MKKNKEKQKRTPMKRLTLSFGLATLVCLPKVCPDFCVNDRVLFLGMGCRGRGLFPLPLPISVEAGALSSGDPLQSGHPLRPQNREVVERFAPVMNRHGPLLGGQPQRQK